MNLDAHPTKDQLRELIGPCDDRAGHHVMWVTRAGEVKLSRISRDASLVAFDQDHPEMQLRCEPFRAGNEYVGPEAAQDERWVAELFERLLRGWRQAKGMPGVVHLERF
jgi:hypothetical protein